MSQLTNPPEQPQPQPQQQQQRRRQLVFSVGNRVQEAGLAVPWQLRPVGGPGASSNSRAAAATEAVLGPRRESPTSTAPGARAHFATSNSSSSSSSDGDSDGDGEGGAARTGRQRRGAAAMPAIGGFSSITAASAVLSALGSRHFWWKVLFSLRVTLIAVLPAAALLAAPTTTAFFVSKTFFTAGAVIGAKETFGLSLQSLFMSFKAVPVAVGLATLLIYVGLHRNIYLWFAAHFLGLFCIAATHTGLCRRFGLLIYNLCLVAQVSEVSSVGRDLTFPVRLAAEFTAGLVLAVVSTLLPYPKLSAERADKKLEEAAHCVALCCSGLCDTFWTASNLQRRVNMTRIAFARRAVVAALAEAGEHIAASSCETFYVRDDRDVAVRRAKAGLLEGLVPLIDTTLRVLEALSDDPGIVHGNAVAAAFGDRLRDHLANVAESVDASLFIIGHAQKWSDLRMPSSSSADAGCEGEGEGEGGGGDGDGGASSPSPARAARGADCGQRPMHPFVAMRVCVADFEREFGSARRDIYYASFLREHEGDTYHHLRRAAATDARLPLTGAVLASSPVAPDPAAQQPQPQPHPQQQHHHSPPSREASLLLRRPGSGGGAPATVFGGGSAPTLAGSFDALLSAHAPFERRRGILTRDGCRFGSTPVHHGGPDALTDAAPATPPSPLAPQPPSQPQPPPPPPAGVVAMLPPHFEALDVARQEFAAIMAFYNFAICSFANDTLAFLAGIGAAARERQRARRAAPLRHAAACRVLEMAALSVWHSITSAATTVFALLRALLPSCLCAPCDAAGGGAVSARETQEAFVEAKEAFKVSLSMVLAMLFFYATDKSANAFATGPTIIAFVCANTSSEALYASSLRLFGTIFGAVVGFFASSLSETPTERVASLCVLVFTFGFFRSNKEYGTASGYAIFVALAMLGPAPVASSGAIARIQQNTFAVIIYFVISIALFPTQPRSELTARRIGVVAALSDTMRLALQGLAAPSAAQQAEERERRQGQALEKGQTQEQPAPLAEGHEPAADHNPEPEGGVSPGRFAFGNTPCDDDDDADDGNRHHESDDAKAVQTVVIVEPDAEDDGLAPGSAVSLRSPPAERFLSDAAAALGDVTRLLTEENVWLPLAEAEPSLARVPYPAAASRDFHAALRRVAGLAAMMVKALRLIKLRDAAAPGTQRMALHAAPNRAPGGPPVRSVSPEFARVLVELGAYGSAAFAAFHRTAQLLIVALLHHSDGGRGADGSGGPSHGLAEELIAASSAFEEAALELHYRKSIGMANLVGIGRAYLWAQAVGGGGGGGAQGPASAAAAVGDGGDGGAVAAARSTDTLGGGASSADDETAELRRLHTARARDRDVAAAVSRGQGDGVAAAMMHARRRHHNLQRHHSAPEFGDGPPSAVSPAHSQRAAAAVAHASLTNESFVIPSARGRSPRRAGDTPAAGDAQPLLGDLRAPIERAARELQHTARQLMSNSDVEGVHTFAFCLVMVAKELAKLVNLAEAIGQAVQAS